MAECRGPASQCVSDPVGGLVCRFGSFWRRWVRCGARGLSGSHARWERRIVVCESEGVGGRGVSATPAAVSSCWPEARPVSQPRGAGPRRRRFEGNRVWGLEETRVSAGQQGKAGRAETRGCTIGGVGFGALWCLLLLLAGARRVGRGWRARGSLQGGGVGDGVARD